MSSFETSFVDSVRPHTKIQRETVSRSISSFQAIARRAFTALSRKTLIKRSGVGWGNVMRGQMHYSDKDKIYK